MRWIFVDAITHFTEWKRICGRKCVSLEEYSLLEPFGRKGELPASLLIESCVQLARWLVLKSSGFESACVLAAVQEFSFTRNASMGDVLELECDAIKVSSELTGMTFRILVNGARIATGGMFFTLIPASEHDSRDALEQMWRELYEPA